MNFYSDQIINNIVDNDPLDTIVDTIDGFKAEYKYLILKYSMRAIHYKYTLNLIENDKNVIAFHCLDNEFAIDNCPSLLIYRKHRRDCENKVTYYVLFTCTKRNFRGQGYGSKILDGLVERVKEENRGSDKRVSIVLSSLETAVLFYEEYGFRWTKECILKHPVLGIHESYNSTKDYYIMELVVIP